MTHDDDRPDRDAPEWPDGARTADDDLTARLRALADDLVARSVAAPDPTGVDDLADVDDLERRRRSRAGGSRPRLLVLGAAATAAAVVAAVALTAGDDRDPQVRVDASSSSTPIAGVPDGAIEYGGNVTVLESPEHGPQLCGSVADSLPPQCGGPDIVGWDWRSVETEEAASGTTWGSYYVVGTWADGQLTLTRPATPPVPMPRGPETDYTTPCEELRGGASSATQDGDRPTGLETEPEYAGSWWDSTNRVMNYAFTANIDQHRAELEAQTTDPVCVVEMPTSQAELLAAQETLLSVSSRPVGIEMYGSGITLDRDETGAPQFVLAIEVIVADPATEAWVESFVGDVPYRLGGLLQPVEPSTTTPSETTAAPETTAPVAPNDITGAEQALAAWTAAGIDDYSFHIRFACFCALTETTIVVEGGVPSATSVRPSDDDTYSTIPALLAELARAEREATGPVDVTWGEYGVPAEASIDWVENGVDDEIAWTITGFRSLEGDGSGDLVSALRTLGVDVANAPAGVTDDDGAVFCGYESRGLDGRGVDQTARRCFVDHHDRREPAVFVTSSPTVEGDPVVWVYESSADGDVRVYVDATRDSFGSGAWESSTCRELVTDPASSAGVPDLVFEVDGCAEFVQIA